MGGFGAYFAVNFGRILSTIERQVILLYENFLQIELIFDSVKNIISSEGKKRDLDTKKLVNEIENINKTIELLNEKLLESNKFKGNISTLDKLKIINIYEKRFTKSWPSDVLDLANENFRVLISLEINKVLTSINEFSSQFEESEKFSGCDNIDSLYKKDIQEAIHVNSIGYGKTAVLCIGRAIENVINNYLKKLFEKKILSDKKFNKLIGDYYHNKIGFLSQILGEEEYTKLKAFSFDRNKGGHPDLGEIDNERSRTLIQQGIWLVIDLQRIIKETKNEPEIEQEKTIELLGGKSEAGQPILHGTPEEKLKQLEGYGGERIEEMREKLKKEIGGEKQTSLVKGTKEEM